LPAQDNWKLSYEFILKTAGIIIVFFWFMYYNIRAVIGCIKDILSYCAEIYINKKGEKQ